MGYAMSRRGGEWAQYAPTMGLFFDIGGIDEYRHTFGTQNESWEQKHDKALGLYGLGIDTDAGMIAFERE
jgi:trans-2-enoyl-CoA reductase